MPWNSGLGSRDISARTMSLGSMPSCTTLTTCSTIGMSTPRSWAICRIAREDFTIFAESMLGKVVLTVTGDARSTLLRVPAAYKPMAPAIVVEASALDARTVRVAFSANYGFLEYVLGQLEGIVLAFHQVPITTIHALPQNGYALDVVHAL